MKASMSPEIFLDYFGFAALTAVWPVSRPFSFAIAKKKTSRQLFSKNSLVTNAVYKPRLAVDHNGIYVQEASVIQSQKRVEN